MPKQRNKPHHHSARERADREGGPQFPEQHASGLPGVPRWSYPTGWVTRPFWRSRSPTVRVAGFAWAAVLLFALAFVVLSHFR
jgi:hypothetical protein